MSPNLEIGDIVQIDKHDKNFNYGDIIVCYQKGLGEEQDIISASRIVSLPGDSIKIKHNICLINGIENQHRIKQKAKLLEYEKSYDEYEEVFPNGKSVLILHCPAFEREEDMRETIKVAENHFFIMGDNRSDSYDSRYFGAIHRNKIIGKVTKIIPAR